MTTKTQPRTQTLKVHYRQEDGTEASTVLCTLHQDAFFNSHPDAYGNGEYGGTCATCGMTA
jgi:hypothetical protein